MPFRKSINSKFALYEALIHWTYPSCPIMTRSISPEFDPFYKSVNLKRNKKIPGKFYGDESWLPNFIQSMKNKDLKSILKEITEKRNQICDANTDTYFNNIKE